MKNLFVIIPIVVVVVGIVIFKSVFFIVNEGQQAIITQFGRPVGEPITEAGLHPKKPFVQEVRYIDKRVLSWDGDPNQIPTKDKKYIRVDTTARWMIIDALKFIQTVRNENGAKSRLDTILDSATRDVISNHNLVEVVRNSNAIIKNSNEKKRQAALRKKEGKEDVVDDEISGDIEKIYVGREKLSSMIVEAADKELRTLGIKLIDVQFRRISYEKVVEKKVYERMISERQRIAQKIRSIGQGKKAQIEGLLTRDLAKIESEAYRKAQGIRGKGEARATAIYAKSLGQDPGFYSFVRTMEAYQNSLTNKVNFLFSSDSEFLKYLKQIK